MGVSPRTARAAPPGWAPQLVPLLPLAGRALSALASGAPSAPRGGCGVPVALYTSGPPSGPFSAVAPLRSPLRFVFAVYRCVRFFCSFVAAVRSTPSGEAVVGVAGGRVPWPPFSPARVSGRGFSRSAKPGAPLEFFFALADRFGGASLRKKKLQRELRASRSVTTAKIHTQ